MRSELLRSTYVRVALNMLMDSGDLYVSENTLSAIIMFTGRSLQCYEDTSHTMSRHGGVIMRRRLTCTNRCYEVIGGGIMVSWEQKSVISGV